MAGLNKEVWATGIKENPIPDHSFVKASTDLSMFVENNKIHLAEAGIEPSVHENYFATNTGELPVANIEDIPNEVVLKTYSTEQTRHRNLEDVELEYDKFTSVINRHKTSLAKNIGKRASDAWTPAISNAHNKVMNTGATDSIVDAVIDAQLFFAELDKTENLNICFTPQHLARIRKENKTLFKDMMANPNELFFGFKWYSYSQSPLFTSAGVKKPFGSVMAAGDKRSSFMWATDEVFRCLGDVEVFPTYKHSGLQADIVSFAQRGLVGKIRANNPKYLAAII